MLSAVCLFEFDADYSMQRHSYSSNTKNVSKAVTSIYDKTVLTVCYQIYFVVRTITTVGNYDYSFSYEFYFDGNIR